MHTIQSIAKEARALFTNEGTRHSTDTGSALWKRKDGAPDWLRNLCASVHVDPFGDVMLPDDWRYQMLVDALDILAECGDEPDEAREAAAEHDAPVYYGERLAWLSSHLWRSSYCDIAARERGEAAPTMQDAIADGFRYEWAFVFDAVCGECRDEAERRNVSEAVNA